VKPPAFGKSARRHRTTASERHQWVTAWESSEQTQEEFARSHGLKVASLRNWIRWQRQSSAAVPEKIQLQELNLDRIVGSELLSSTTWELEIRLPSGIAVAVARHTPAERLRQIVEALRC
jgi:hypothetical protein